MRVSESQRVLFVHVPKTGGSTLDAMIDAEVADARKIKGRTRHEGLASLLEAEPALADYWSCGFVRNPWSRMVSWWAMSSRFADGLEAGGRRQRRKMDRLPHIWAPLVRYSGDFDTFVMKGTQHVERLAVPQVSLLTAGDKRVDFVGRIEAFVSDTNVLREKLGLAPVTALPKRNPSTHAHYSQYYTEETRQRVAEIFAADIEAFGYTFEVR
jgi:hypothetical protein